MGIPDAAVDAVRAAATSEAVARLLRLKLLKDHGSYLKARCPNPAHKDENPSFVVHKNGGGFKCWGACKASGGDGIGLWALAHGLDTRADFRRILDELAEALGIAAEASPNGKHRRRTRPRTSQPEPEAEPRPFEEWPALPEDTEGPKSAPGRTVYQLRNAAGELLAFHPFGRSKDGKKRPWWTLGKAPGAKAECPGLDPTDERKGLSAEDRALYGPRRYLEDAPLWGSERLQNWKGRLILVTEGENDGAALHRCEIPALASVTGSSSAHRPEALLYLKGEDLLLWADYARDGFGHMIEMGRNLETAGASVRLLAPEWLAKIPPSPKAKEKGELDGRGAADWVAWASQKMAPDEMAKVLAEASS